jgi:pimeloyl-ACP methyl ester carboxylesterase
VQTYSRGGLVFDVLDSGPPQGPTVVCLHGFPQDSSAYAAVTPRLVATGCRVLAPDQRGYSPGARPSGRSAYVVPELLADVVALLDAAGVRSAHVVGHDWGGLVGWALAAAHPDRVRSLTSLSTPHPAAMVQGAIKGTQALRSAYMGVFQVPVLPEQVLLAGGGKPMDLLLRRSGLPAEHVDRYVQRMRQPEALSAALGWYRALVLPGGGVGPVTVPTSYLVGTGDPFFSGTSVTATAQHVRGPYELVHLPAGHWLPETQSGAVAAAVLDHVRNNRPAG